MDAGGLKPNIWQRFERLGSAWIQAKRGITDSARGAQADDFEALSKPSRRTRTPGQTANWTLVRTVGVSCESVVSVSRRFELRNALWLWCQTCGGSQQRRIGRGRLLPASGSGVFVQAL